MITFSKLYSMLEELAAGTGQIQELFVTIQLHSEVQSLGGVYYSCYTYRDGN